MQRVFPKKLKKEPLFDAVFELRFNSRSAASSILPGFLFSKLSGSDNIEKMPAAQLPEQVRETDPNLQFAPLIRFHWGSFLILIGDRSILIACKMPYPGWIKFKAGILEVLQLLDEINIIESTQRFSLKYVDLIPAREIMEQVSLVNINLNIADHTLVKEVFQIRVEIPKGDINNVVQILSSAEITSVENGLKTYGIVIDIDTMKTVMNVKLKNLLLNLSTDLEELHDSNKEIFFRCLKQETIDALEPIYE